MLILTEKENVAKNYANILGLKKIKFGLYSNDRNDIKITYASGHLYESLQFKDYDRKYETWNLKDFPFIPQTYKFKPINEKSKNDLRKAVKDIILQSVKNNEEIVIATDPDREGEVIAYLILNSICPTYRKVTRLWCLEGLTKEEVVRALKERKPVTEYENLRKEGLNQKNADWLLGLNITALYTLKNKGELFSVGRVQSAVLKEIYKRNEEIENFKVSYYYEVVFQSESGTLSYLINQKRKDKVFDTLDEAEKALKDIEGKEINLRERTEKEKKESRPRLYDLAHLQMDAYTVYSIAIDETLDIAEVLYNEKGKISYPRTDSVCMGDNDRDEFVKKLRGCEEKNPHKNFYEENIKRSDKRIFNDKEKGAHHALIITSFMEREDTKDWKVYDLVLRRCLMQGFNDFSYKEIHKTYTIESYEVVSDEKIITDLGFKELDLRFNKNAYCENETEILKGKVSFKIEKKERKKPEYYNESTILAFMRNPGKKEGEGINLVSLGTQATQASIVKILFKRGYITNKGKHIEILPKGKSLVTQIKRNRVLDENTDAETTTRWDKLNNEDSFKFLKAVEILVKKVFEEEKENIEMNIKSQNVGKCPYCNGDILKGKNGYYCSGHKEKDCPFSISYHVMGNEITDEIIKKLLEERKTDVMQGVKKDGGNVDFYFSLDDNNKVLVTFLGNEVEVCKCPDCLSAIFERSKVFKCSNPKCQKYFYKESKGIVFSKSIMKELFDEKKTVETVRKNKEGKESKVKLSYDFNKNDFVIEYV